MGTDSDVSRGGLIGSVSVVSERGWSVLASSLCCLFREVLGKFCLCGPKEIKEGFHSCFSAQCTSNQGEIRNDQETVEKSCFKLVLDLFQHEIDSTRFTFEQRKILLLYSCKEFPCGREKPKLRQTQID